MTTNSDKLLLSEKIATKMCHDLSGTAMSVFNSLEMLKTGDSDDSFNKIAIDIATRGASGFSAKIKFFRIAFGSLGQNEIDGVSLNTLMKNYLQSSFDKYELSLTENLTLTAKEAKIIFSVIIFAMTVAMPGFKLSLSRSGNQIILEIKNPKDFIIPPELTITDSDVRFATLTPGNSPLFLGGMLAGEYGKNMKINIKGNSLLLLLQ